MAINQDSIIGVIGSGAMGAGIAHVAAVAGHQVVLYDTNDQALDRAKKNLTSTLQKLQEKGKITSAEDVLGRVSFADNIVEFSHCGLIIEAIIEKLEVKQELFQKLATQNSSETILASNTSTIPITQIAAAVSNPERVVGMHFFNPAHLMKLVEIISGEKTNDQTTQLSFQLAAKWGKTAVLAKDRPGFIVNRIGKMYHTEPLHLLEKNVADANTIDALLESSGFKMGPFALMDYIGHDVNYVVTKTVFESFFYDPRYKPSFSQNRLLEAGWLGRKSGRGFYDYSEGAENPAPAEDTALSKEICERILVMLINEAVDALHLNVATAADLETAMTKGVNYPKGLLSWCDEWGAAKCLEKLDSLYNNYHEDRYRASCLLRKYAVENKKFV